MVHAKFEHKGNKYDITIPDLDYYPYVWEEGNFSCDCNRSLFIQRYGYPDFEELDCGHEIKLIEISG